MAFPAPVMAAPYFFITGSSSASAGYDQTWLVGLDTDGAMLTTVQTMVNFDESLLRGIQLSNINSKCSFWGPADPSLGLVKDSTPYFVGGNKLIISCGFSRPGYMSTATGDLILSITFKPLTAGQGSFSFSNTELRYIGNAVTPGISYPFDFSVEDSTPAPTALPTATPSPTPTPEMLTMADLNLVRWGGSSGRSSSGSAQSAQPFALTEPDIDNVIPPPPANLPLRPKASPLSLSDTVNPDEKKAGEVLSLQSLKELIIPGKSSADKNLVMFNFIMMITFLVLLAILIWRLVVASRSNKMKYRHMSELLEGELAVIESKIDGVKLGTVTNDEVTSSLEELKKKMGI